MKDDDYKTGMHHPVLSREVIKYLNIDSIAHLKKEGRIIDATIGFGGHSKEFIKRGLRVLGIDEDEVALRYAKKELEKACPVGYRAVSGYFILVQSNFRNIDRIALENSFTEVDAILFDLGISNPQITSNELGISFSNENAPLDMRINQKAQSVKACDLLNLLNEHQLIELFETTLSYLNARQLAKRVVQRRAKKEFVLVGDLLRVIDELSFRKKKVNKATLPFLALRMAVNSELENLAEAMPKAFNLLVGGGRLAIISFHSGEDRIVKNYFTKLEIANTAKVITKKPIIPDIVEKNINPRSRSSKLRVIEKK